MIELIKYYFRAFNNLVQTDLFQYVLKLMSILFEL